jgi:hypothetical protein
MKANNALLVAGLLAAPLSAMASMSAMDNAELSQVSGQAYVVSFGAKSFQIKDLTQRSAVAAAVANEFPGATNVIRQTVVLDSNAAIDAARAAVLLTAGPLIVPLLPILVTPKVSYQPNT